MRTKSLLHISIFGLVSSISHAADDFFPPLTAFETPPYLEITLGSEPSSFPPYDTFPKLSPGDVIAFYIDHKEKVRHIFCDPISSAVTAPSSSSDIVGFTAVSGNQSSNVTIKLDSSNLDSGAHSASSEMSTQSYAAVANSQSSTSSIAVSSEQLKADTQSSTSSIAVSGEQITAETNSQKSQAELTTTFKKLSTDLVDTEAQKTTNQTLTMTGDIEGSTLSTTVSDTISIANFKSSQQSTSTHTVFSSVAGLSKYLEDFFHAWFDEEGSFAILDEEGNAIDEIIDGDELTLIEDAKLEWQKRVQRFSFDDKLLNYLADFPTDTFRTSMTLPENPKTSAGISCNYEIPKNLEGIHFGHHVGVQFKLQNMGNVPLTDILIAISPAKNTSYLAAKPRIADVTSYIPSSDIILHRRFKPVGVKNTYQTQFFVTADKWELPKPPKEEKGFFDIF